MLKQLLLLPLLALCLLTVCNSGCVTPPVSTGVVTTTGILSDQTVNATQKALLVIGSLLETAPGTAQALLDAGKITKDEFNQVVPVYNKVLAGWKVAVAALKVGATTESYNAAFAAFLANKVELDALMAQFGIGGTK